MNSESLAPGLLLAAAPLGDPNFTKAVVVLATHSEEGALGWVINGLEIAPVFQLLRDAGLTPESVRLPKSGSYELPVRVGGPVSPRSAWLLYRRQPRWVHKGEIELTDNWAAAGDRSIVEAIARGDGPSDFRLVLGYAGWAPGQLDEEIRAGVWMPASLDEDVVFSPEADQMWERAYERVVGVSPYAFTGLRPGVA